MARSSYDPARKPSPEPIRRFGDVNPNWPHCDGIRPRPSRCEEPSTGVLGLSPEDADGVAVDLGKQVINSIRRCEQVVDMKAEVAVAPVLALGGAPLDDGEISRGDLVLDADVVAGKRR